MKTEESRKFLFSKYSMQKNMGFTLIELLVVLLIIFVSMGLFFGMNFRQKESVLVRSFASELSQFLRTARSYAVLEGRQNFCMFCPETRSVTEELRGRTVQVPEGVDLVFCGGSKGNGFVLATFFSNGSLIIEKFSLKSGEYVYFPETDPFSGKVSFHQN